MPLCSPQERHSKLELDTLLKAETERRSEAIAVLSEYVASIDFLQPGTVFSDNPPPEPAEGDNWFNKTTGVKYTFYNTAWIQVS